MRQTFQQLLLQLNRDELDWRNQEITDQDIDDYFTSSYVGNKLEVRILLLDYNNITQLSSVIKILKYVCLPASLLVLRVSHNQINPISGNEFDELKRQLPEFRNLMGVYLEDNRAPIASSSLMQPLTVAQPISAVPVTKSIYQSSVSLVTHDLFMGKLAKKYPALKPANNFTTGARKAINRGYSLLFLAGITIDLIKYTAQPDARYETTVDKIILGSASDQMALSSTFGDFLEDSFLYWLVPTVILSAAVLLGAIEVIRAHREERRRGYRVADATDPEAQPIFPTGQNTSQGNIFTRTTGAYSRWSRGERAPDLLDIPFLMVAGFILISQLRFVGLLIRKIVDYEVYAEKKRSCVNDELKQYLYLDDYGDFECVVCPPSATVSARDAFTSQGCLNGLLSSGQSAEIIISELDNILLHPDFKLLDLTKLNWQQWSLSQWKSFLDKIADSVSQLDVINMSREVFTGSFSDDGKIEYFSNNFLTRVKTKVLLTRNLGLGDELLSALMPGIVKSGTKYWDITRCLAGNIAAGNIAQLFKQSSLEAFIFAYNLVGNEGMLKLIDQFPLTLRYFEGAYNPYTGAILASLGDQLTFIPVEYIGMGGVDLSTGDMGAFGEDLALSNVRSISIPSTNVAQSQVVELFTKLKGGKVEKADISDLGLDGSHYYQVLVQSSNTSMWSITANDNPITSDDIEQFMPILPPNIHELGLAGCGYDQRGYELLVNSTYANQLYSLDASRNNLGNPAPIYLAQVLREGKKIWLRMNLASNGITDVGGVPLGEAMATGFIGELIFSDNQCGDPTLAACKASFATSKAWRLMIDKNKYSPEMLAQLIKASDNSALTELFADIDPVYLDGGVDIAKALITPTPGINDIGDKTILRAEAKALRRASAATSLCEIYLPNSMFSPAGIRAMNRVLPSLPNTNVYYQK